MSSKIDPLRVKDRVFNNILSAANNHGHFEPSEILKPLSFGKLTEGKSRTVLIRQCIDIKQAEVNATNWASSTEETVTYPRRMEVT